MSIEYKWKRAGYFSILIIGMVLGGLSVLGFIEGLVSGYPVYASKKYGLSFFGTEALVIQAELSILGLLLMLLISQHNTRRPIITPHTAHVWHGSMI